MDIPTLETERLLLKPYSVDDFEAYAEMWSDPDVVRFIGGKPFGREQAWGKLLRNSGHWQHMGFGFFAVVEKESGRLAGEAGFQELMREMTPSIEGTLEAGWALVPSSQGWGYATEAMTAAIGWCSEAFPGRRMTCLIDVDNLPSIRVANRLGFKEFARTNYGGATVVLFER